MITYQGTKTNHGMGPQSILRNGRPLSLKASLKIRPHSPAGFNWGYGGSGPAQLALALRYNATHNKQLALDNYQAFKWQFVAHWGDSWQITDHEILTWLQSTQVAQVRQ